MTRSALFGLGVALALMGAGCGGGGGGDTDGGTTPGMDGGPGHDSGPSNVDAFVGGPQDAGPGVDGGCIPSFEICGDHIDQDCNGHDVGCGDNDRDGFDACRPPMPDFTMCDCDDTNAANHPARGSLPGGAETCDGFDNDCDFRIDESAACCADCASLGTDLTRADTCTADGHCDCLGEPGVGACPAGQACCTDGCADLQTNAGNCGYCGTHCTDRADTCMAGNCVCGTSGTSCPGASVCTAGSCTGG